MEGKKTTSYKKTIDDKYRKRKNPNSVPLPTKRVKCQTKETRIGSELNVLPDSWREEENCEQDTWEEAQHLTPLSSWSESEATELNALEKLEKVIQESATQDTPLDFEPHEEAPPQNEKRETTTSREATTHENIPPDFGSSEKGDEACEDTTKTIPKEKKFVEYYVNGYCLRNNLQDQYYAQNQAGDELYWRDSVNAEIYAYKSRKIDNDLHKIEYPAIQNNEPIYIYDRAGKPRYPVDLTTHEVVFPRNPDTNEEFYLPDRKGNLFYPENKFGQQFYRKDAEGNDVLINNTYAQYADGSQIYPKKSNGDEFYLKLGNLEVPAVKRVVDKYVAYYARKENGDQIYPREYEESDEEKDSHE